MATDIDGQRDGPDVGEDPSAGSPRRRRPWLLVGDRPFMMVFIAAVVLGLLLVSGPFRTWATQRDLVDSRSEVVTALERENRQLAERVDDLNDPDTIEAEAREEQGMYRPGEVPYVLVPPEVDQPQLGSDVRPEDADEPGLLDRIGQAIADLFG